MRRGPWWFSGSADAIYQNLNIVGDERPDYILVFGADHIYRMDPRQMLAQHVETGAAATVAAIRVPAAEAQRFGIIEPGAGHPDRPLRGEAARPPGPGRRRARSICSPPWAIMCSPPRPWWTPCAKMPRTPIAATTWAGTSCRASWTAGDAHVYDFANNDVPGCTERRTRLLARRRHPRQLLRRQHGPGRGAAGVQPVQPRLAHLHQPGPAAAGQVRLRGRRPRRARPLDSIVSGRVHHFRRHGAPVGHLPRRAGRARGAGRGLGDHGQRRASARGPWCAGPSSTRTSWSPRERGSAPNPSSTPATSPSRPGASSSSARAKRSST